MKTRTKRRIIVIVASIFALVVILVIFYKPIYYRFYWGDRIQGTVRLVIDNEQAALQEHSILIIGEDKMEYNDDGTAFIAFRGGEYGDYGFYVENSLIGQHVLINCFQHNWWSVQTFDLTISVNTSARTLSFGGYYTTISDNCEILKEEVLKTVDLSGDWLDIIMLRIGM